VAHGNRLEIGGKRPVLSQTLEFITTGPDSGIIRTYQPFREQPHGTGQRAAGLLADPRMTELYLGTAAHT
jgi:hypothetical protein